MPRLVDDYVKTGQLRIYFKDYAFLGPDSDSAALVSRAVWEVPPEHYYDWHRAMFEKQDRENGGWGSKADILALTKMIPGIDIDKIDRTISTQSGRFQQAIAADLTEGGAMGVNGTPGMIIGTRLFSGAQPYENFKSVIDAELSK